MTIARSLLAQAVPTRRLAPLEVEFPVPFTEVAAVRALRDGRVIVVDSREATVRLINFDHRTSTEVGRTGSGPGEYQRPNALFPLRGDSTVLLDEVSRTSVLISPTGRPIGSFYGAEFSATTPRTFFLLPPTAVDPAGRLYVEAQPIRFKRGGGVGEIADSAAIQRWTRGSATRDTVAWLRVALPASRQVTRVGVIWKPDYRAFKAYNQWAVGPDGRVAVVNVEPYRVDLWMPSGERRPGRAIAYQRVRVSTEHRRAFLEEARRPVALVTPGGAGTPASTRMVELSIPDEAWSFPEYLPPFLAHAVTFDPDGWLWVRRTARFGSPPTYDVIDNKGDVALRVELPQATRLVGFGIGTVYLTRTDADDQQFLQRYRWRVTSRP